MSRSPAVFAMSLVLCTAGIGAGAEGTLALDMRVRFEKKRDMPAIICITAYRGEKLVAVSPPEINWKIEEGGNLAFGSAATASDVGSGLFRLLRPTSETLLKKGRVMDFSVAVSRQEIDPPELFLRDVSLSTELSVNARVSVLRVDSVSREMELHVAEFAGTIKTARIWSDVQYLRLVRVRRGMKEGHH